MNKRITDS